MTPYISGQTVDGLVTARSVLFHGLENDPVQIPSELLSQCRKVCAPALGDGSLGISQTGKACTGFWRIRFPNDPLDLTEACCPKCIRIERQSPYEQFIQENSQRINVCSRINI